MAAQSALQSRVPKGKRHDHLPGEKGYFNAAALLVGEGPLWVCEGAFDALALLAASVPRVVAIFGGQGWGGGATAACGIRARQGAPRQGRGGERWTGPVGRGIGGPPGATRAERLGERCWWSAPKNYCYKTAYRIIPKYKSP